MSEQNKYKYMSKADITTYFDPELIYASLKEVSENRSNWKDSGIVEVELDSYGNLAIIALYDVQDVENRFRD